MRKYELMTIFPLEEEKSKVGLETLRADLASFGAEIEKEEVFGDRDLTYEVKKQKRGHFVLFKFFELGVLVGKRANLCSFYTEIESC